MSTLRTYLLSFVLMAAGIGTAMAQVAPSVGADPDPIVGVSPGDTLNLPLVFFPGDVTGILLFSFDLEFPVGVDPVLTDGRVNGNDKCDQGIAFIDPAVRTCFWNSAGRVLSVNIGSFNALDTDLDPFGFVAVQIDPTVVPPATLDLTARNISCELAQGVDPNPPCEGSNGQIQVGAVANPALNIVETSLEAAPDATFTVENVGGAPLDLATIGLTNGTDFSITGGTCTIGFTLQANQANNCTVVVSIVGTPTLVTDTLTVTTDTANANPNTDFAQVTGGTAPAEPALNIVETSLEAAPDATFTVENVGGTDLNLATIGLTDGTDFSITGGTCTIGFTLLASQANNCTVVVSIVGTPTPVTDTLTVTTDTANANPNTDSAEVTGGTAPTEPALNIVETTLEAAPDATFTVENIGSTDLDLATIGLATGTDFSITGGTCTIGFTLLASQANNCTVVVSIVGTPAMAVQDTLTVTTGTAGANPSTDSATVTGGGTSDVLTTDVNSLNLMMTGDSGVITVTNTGDTEVALSPAGLVGDDPTAFSFTTTCGTTLAAMASCDYTVTYNGVEPATGTLTIDPLDEAVAIALNGGRLPIAIPTLSQWSMMIMGALLAMLAMVGLRRQS